MNSKLYVASHTFPAGNFSRSRDDPSKEKKSLGWPLKSGLKLGGMNFVPLRGIVLISSRVV